MKRASTATKWGHSRWETLERCPKAYELKYVYGIEQREQADAPALGSVYHRALAAYYTGGSVKTAVALGPEDAHVKASALALADAYVRFWGDRSDFRRDEVLGAEVHVERKEPFPFTTRIDLLVRRGKTQIQVDHKTSARDSGDFMTEHSVSNQFLGAAYAGAPRMVLLNRAIKTATPKFDRFEFEISEHRLKEWERDFARLNADLKRYERLASFPRHRSSCVGRFRECAFYSLCHRVGRESEYKIPSGVNLGKALR